MQQSRGLKKSDVKNIFKSIELDGFKRRARFKQRQSLIKSL